jgi:hypothetical protein
MGEVSLCRIEQLLLRIALEKVVDVVSPVNPQ